MGGLQVGEISCGRTEVPSALEYRASWTLETKSSRRNMVSLWADFEDLNPPGVLITSAHGVLKTMFSFGKLVLWPHEAFGDTL